MKRIEASSTDWNHSRAKPKFFAGVSGPQAVHSYGCPVTRTGRSVSGPCDCGGVAAQKRLDAFWDMHKMYIEADAKHHALEAFKEPE